MVMPNRDSDFGGASRLYVTVLGRNNRAGAQQRLMRDYFVDEPTYNPRIFRRRFRMQNGLFLRICGDLEREYRYFQQIYDGAEKLGFSAIQKCTSAIRQLAYGVNSDLLDEYLHMSERTSRESLAHFCSGSIDCMHWAWEMCLNAWRGTHTRGDIGHPSMILQAVASSDLWIWNAYFGQQGSHNDINVFGSSPILEEILNACFYANDNYYARGYYLGDGIYPEYATFVKTFTDPVDEKRILFKKKQEAARKDIERAFGVLKKRWKVLKNPARYWDRERMQDVVYACVILHNMILEDEDKATCQDFDEEDPTLVLGYWYTQTPMEQRLQNLRAVKN
uniref:protein ALP1-like n=1 Tax=Erigeron canadensis TaxID=72917 RepID=UPI001CB8A4DE|nr:protein ALP1-like [Erigeron canadensis]